MGVEVFFRNMEMSDLDQVCAIEQAVFSDPWSREGFAESLGSGQAILLTAVSEAQKVVGYCCLYCALDEGEIVNVAVSETFRKQGIGERMVRHLMQAGTKRGAKNFYLEVRAGNQPAQRLYEKLGFKTVGIRKNFYEKPVENALVMMCALPDITG